MNLRAEPKEIARTIAVLFPAGDVVELRIPKTEREGTVSGYFDNPELLVKAVAARNGDPAIYVTLNPVHPALLARAANRVRQRVRTTTSDEDILCRRWLLVDCDAVRPAEISSTYAEHESALERARQIRFDLAEEGWPAPLLADSGNGSHLLFRIDLPNDGASDKLVKGVLKALAKRYNDADVKVDVTMSNASRVTKCYATMVRKGDDVPTRPHRLSYLVDVPNTMVPVSREQLEELAATIAAPPALDPPTHQPRTSKGGASLPDDDLIERARKAGDGGKFSHLWDGHWKGDYASQSEADLALCMKLAFWTGRDASRIDQLFRQSAMMRNKWDREDYRAATISKAIEQTSEVWTPRPVPTKKAGQPAPKAEEVPPPRNQAARSTGRPKAEPTEREDAGTESDEDALPGIRTNGRELRDVSTDALAALWLANNPPKLFSRAGAPVRVDLTEDGHPVIVILTDTHVRGEMTRAANFFKLSKKLLDYIRTPVDPPLNVARDLLTRPPQELGLPALEAIAESPFITADGIVICQPGYHAGTRTFYAPSGELKDFHVPEKPTDNEANAARELIDEVFVNFPFKDIFSKANLIALFLTPELRQAIRGNVPCALLDAPQMGSGKSLAAEVVALKTTGADALMKPAPTRDEEEWRKLLTATIQDGQPLAVFDNVDSVLNSSNLALALTANTWTDRLLGKTALVTFPVRTIFVATGNNIALGNDLARRCYWIRLDAQSSTPWLNREFKHPDLRTWVLENRGRLVSAVLILAKGWFIAGCPAAKTPTLGSFEEWCRVVGGVLQHAGIEGFLGNLDDLYQQADPSMVAWEAFLAALKDDMPAEGFKVSQVVDKIRTNDPLRNTLPEDLGDLDPVEKFRLRLGKAFLKRNHRRHGDRRLYLDRGDPKQGSVMWSVREGEG